MLFKRLNLLKYVPIINVWTPLNWDSYMYMNVGAAANTDVETFATDD